MAADGEWLLRIEDIDPPREMPGASERIITTLRAHGFEWTGPVRYQSESPFDTALTTLFDKGQAFRCTCSRKQIRAKARLTGAVEAIYPGTCRYAQLTENGRDRLAVRVRVDDTTIAFDDALYGRLECALATRIGDFIVRRSDGLVAYVLAVVLDDHRQGITEVVRGVDLLEFTPAQIFLQRILGLDTPRYLHIPVAVNSSGVKLSKQTGAAPVDDTKPARNLVRCLEFLNQNPPASLESEQPTEIWKWAQANWCLRRLATVVKKSARKR
jgi:glutamyl-Q tRNA(Asp) synthetase